MSLALPTQSDLARQSSPGRFVRQLPEKKRLVHRNDILAVHWGLGRSDATDRVSIQVREETNWALVVMV